MARIDRKGKVTETPVAIEFVAVRKDLSKDR